MQSIRHGQLDEAQIQGAALVNADSVLYSLPFEKGSSLKYGNHFRGELLGQWNDVVDVVKMGMSQSYCVHPLDFVALWVRRISFYPGIQH